MKITVDLQIDAYIYVVQRRFSLQSRCETHTNLQKNTNSVIIYIQINDLNYSVITMTMNINIHLRGFRAKVS